MELTYPIDRTKQCRSDVLGVGQERFDEIMKKMGETYSENDDIFEKLKKAVAICENISEVVLVSSALGSWEEHEKNVTALARLILG